MKKNLHFLTLFAAGICCYHSEVFAKPILSSNTLNAFNKTNVASLTLKAVPIVIKGRVVGEDGLPLIGVTITIKGTRVRAATDKNGNYSIKVPDNTAILVFSFISFKTQEIPVESQTTIDVKMVSSVSALDEVVVVGYGTSRVRNLTSSQSQVKAADIEKYNSPTFQTALEGRMAGVEMNESSGVPGAAVNIRIRGISSINGSSGPLYILDGIPIISGTGGDGDNPMTNNDVAGVQSNPLTDINPNDIESVTILKDAAATAIYGARGGAGVVLITTKKAQAGKSSFNFRYQTGISHVSGFPSLLNGPQFLSIIDEAYANTFHSVAGQAGLPVPATPITTNLVGFDRGMADTTNVSHLGDILRNAVYREVSLSASNGTDRTKFYISGTYRTTNATFKGNDLSQFQVRINVDHQLSKYIKVGATLAPAYSTEWKLGSGVATLVGGYGAALTANLPIYPTYNPDGSYFSPWNNAVAFLNRDLYHNNQTRLDIVGSAFVQATLSPGLTFQTTVQRQDFNQLAHGYIDGTLRVTTSGNTVSPFPNDPIPYLSQTNSFGYSNSLDSYFSYTKNFDPKNVIDAALGMRFSKSDFGYEAMYSENTPNSNQQYPAQGASIQAGFQTGAQGDPSATLGYFFRLNYIYDQKYLLGLVVNRDGSSRFGTDKRYGTFPAISGGWIATDEKFLENNKVLSFLKFRGSAGLTGNAQGIANTAAKSTWASAITGGGVYKNDAGNVPNQPADVDLRWEKGVKFDAGIDMGFFHDRINITADWYHYTTTDLLLAIPVPVTFGYGAPASNLTYTENRGSLLNHGLEFSFNTINLQGKFQWSTTFNISHNETYIISLGGLTPDQLAAGGGNTELFEGHNGPVYDVIQWVGVDPATGGELIKDKNGNTVLAETQSVQQLSDDRKQMYDKPTTPKFFGGFGNNFSYKNFKLSIFFAYRYGFYLLDAGERQREYVGDFNFASNGNTGLPIVLGNLSSAILNRWTTPGQITNIPKLYYNDPTNDVLRGLNTSRFLSDASFIRLKNIDLSYTLPKSLIKRLGLRTASVNITGQNLLLWTKFKGPDPEAQTIIANNYRERNVAFGIINNPLPLPLMLTAGINVGF